MEAEKSKRQLTAEQLENLKKGREKARLVKIQNKEINETRRIEERERKKEAILNEKREKDAKREEAYKAVIDLKNAKSKKEVNNDEDATRAQAQPEKPAPKPKSKPKYKIPPPPPPDEPSEEEEEDYEEQETEEVYEPPPRKTTVKAPLPPPSQFKRKPRPSTRQKQEATNAELYQNANIEMLRKKFMEQTRHRLINDLFNY